MSVTSTIGTRGKDDGWRTSHFPWIPASAPGRSASEVLAMKEGILISMLGAIALTLAACAGAGAICAGSGGTYSGGTCTRWSPSQEAAQKWCETHGGSYLTGPNVCAFGEGQ